MKKMNKKGFSLIELIVVIAIMAVLVGVLTPALLSYVERSRAQKDDSAMGEVVNAITLALADQSIYDEMLQYRATSGENNGKTVITFKNNGDMDFDIDEASIDTASTTTLLGAAQVDGEYATGNTADHQLADRLKNICGDPIKLTSRTHRTQDFEVVIDFGTTDYTVKVTRGNSGAGWKDAE